MNPYQIQLTSKAEKQLRKLSPSIRKKILVEILKLAQERFPNKFKPLIGKKSAQFRIRIGDYRVLYDVYDDDAVVLILIVGHRRDIYR